MSIFARLLSAERGSIMVLAALSLTAVMGMSGLAVEVGSGYATKVRNQRVADMAALGAAAAYRNGSQSSAAATQVAKDIVVANGLPLSAATVTTGTSTVQVQVTSAVPIKLASLLTQSASYNVTNSATASLVSNNVAGCVVALSNSSTAVSATGGASITASGCAINTNGTVYSSNGSAKVSAQQIVAQAINQSGGGVTTTPTANNWNLKANGASDQFKSNATLQNAFCLVNQMTGYSDPDYAGGNRSCSTPVVAPTTNVAAGGADWSLGYVKKGTTAPSMYETADYSCKYVVPPGNYTIGKLTVGGGCSITFQGGSGYTLYFDQIDMSGSNMTIGDGTLTVAGDFHVDADNPILVGNGAHSFGSLTIDGGKKIDLGSGNFNLSGGVSVGGGAYLRVAIGAGETVTIGKDSSGNAISVNGSSQVCFTATCGVPTVAAGTFSANGNVGEPGSGSTIVFPMAVTHVIAGNLSLTAAATFGPGLYLISGNFTNGTGCGSCIMSGVDVTFVLGGTFSFAGGSYFDLAAPKAGTSYGITDILIATKSSSPTSMGGGANGKAAGLVYAPNSAFSSSGGTSISANGDACLMVVVNTISVSGSGTVNTGTCSNLSTSTTGKAALIQ